jgi:hypothetical protein
MHEPRGATAFPATHALTVTVLMMDADIRSKVAANLFPPARSAVEPWDAFPWHLDRSGRCDTWRSHSSQALAVDVFGSLKVAPQADRDAIMDALAGSWGLPTGGPWRVELEWVDPVNHLTEKSPTQVDAIATSPSSLICFECKFTERGGRCSQTRRLPSGTHMGAVQCNGNYTRQTNPLNGKQSRCALSGKGIRYWEIIPEVFGYGADADHEPCPFAGCWLQWMRNLTLCWEVACHEGLKPPVAIVYADSCKLQFPAELRSPGWSQFMSALRQEAIVFRSMPYRSLIALARQAVADAGGDTALWDSLDAWVDGKIRRVTG